VQAGVGFVADFNEYHQLGGQLSFQTYAPPAPPENYTGLSAWRTATGQEANSVDLGAKI
jgi:hypothetical protein